MFHPGFDTRFTHALLMAIVIHQWAGDDTWWIGPLVVVVAGIWAYAGARLRAFQQ